jgi:hypothetical protein
MVAYAAGYPAKRRPVEGAPYAYEKHHRGSNRNQQFGFHRSHLGLQIIASQARQWRDERMVVNPNITPFLQSCRMKTDVEQEPTRDRDCAGSDEPPSAALKSSEKSKYAGYCCEHYI